MSLENNNCAGRLLALFEFIVLKKFSVHCDQLKNSGNAVKIITAGKRGTFICTFIFRYTLVELKYKVEIVLNSNDIFERNVFYIR